MDAIIMAAGYATRMYPLTLNKSKCLLPIAGKPIIEYIIEKIKDIKEIDQIFIVTNNKFYKDFLNWSKKFKEVEIINDQTTSNEDRLGTIGDLIFVIKNKKINEDILIINGDNLFNFSLLQAFKLVKEKNKDAIAVYDCKDIEIAKKMGVVGIDNKNKIVWFTEKPEKPKSTLISTGIYFYKKETIPLIEEFSKLNVSDKSGAFVEWLHKKKEVYAYNYNNKNDIWVDIGSIEQYQEANEKWSII